MDELDLLERVRADIEPDMVAIRRVRRRLLRHALVPLGGPRRRRRVIAAGAIAAACALMITLPLTLPGGPAVPRAAAVVLSKASHAAQQQVMPDPGEYLHIRTVTTSWSDEGSETTTQERWVPADMTAPAYFRDFAGSVYQWKYQVPSILTDPATTRDELLSWLRRPNGDLRGDDAAYERVGEILADYPASLDAQARLFDALPYIHGVDIVAKDQPFGSKTATIVGRSQPMEAQFAFDQASGQFLGIQGLAAPGSSRPLSYRTIYRTNVVTQLPERAIEEREPN